LRRYASSAAVVVTLLCVGVGVTGALGAGCGLTPIDLFPAKVGAVFGVFNMLINTPGFITPHVQGVLLDHAGCPSANATRHVP